MKSKRRIPMCSILLLQVMDHGTLTDNNGRKADFRHVIIVMTTNAGAFEMSRPSIGFTVSRTTTSDGMEAIRRLFSPEFRNRLDSRHSNSAAWTRTRSSGWSTSCWSRQRAQLETKRVSISVSDQARRWIATRGYDPKIGCAADGASHSGAHQTAARRRSYCSASSSTAGHVEVTLSEDGEKLKLDTHAADEPAKLLSHEN